MDPGASQTLLDAARTGSEEAKEALLQRYAGRLLSLIRLRMGPSLRAHLESQDLLQATLLKSYTRLREFRGEDPAALMAWLAAIARHEVADQVDFQRRQRRDLARETALGAEAEALPAPVRSALSLVIWSEQSARLEAALEALPEPHREVIVLRKLEELSFTEIGARLGRSEDACRMLFARAMAALTLRLGKAG